MTYRFLVVDDTHFMRKMAADCLKQHGHTVIGEAVNGKEAVRMYKELQPDIVMMDLTMPEMNGIDAIKEILQFDKAAVVLICSASNQQDLIFEALDIGAKGYLMKPFNPQRLEEVIRKYAAPHVEAAAANKAMEDSEEANLSEAGGNPDADGTVVAEQADTGDADTAAAEAAAAVLTDEDATVADAEEAPVADAADADAVAAAEEPVDEIPAPAAAPAAEAPASAPAEAPKPAPAAAIKPMKGNDKVRSFTSSMMCHWNEEFQGETAHYSVICTESENKIIIEMTDSETNVKRTIPFSFDGFRQLSDWLDAQTGGRSASSVR